MAHGSVLFMHIQKMTGCLKTSCSRGWLLPWLVLALLALPLTAVAQGDAPARPAPVILTDSQDKYPLGLHLELLAGPTGQLTIEDVSSPAYTDQFIPSQTEIPNPGTFLAGAIWLRFQVRNEAGPATSWRLARDLHDSITQSLYSLNLFAHAVRQAALYAVDMGLVRPEEES